MEEIKIGYKTFKIEKAIPNDKLIYDGLKCYGEIFFDENIIRLNAENSQNQNKATLIHECLHGISDMYFLDMDEDLVSRLANAISTTLVQNELEIVQNKNGIIRSVE